MPSSHPPSLVTVIERTLREECALPSGARLTVAVSGGADSLALLHALSLVARRLPMELLAHGVDHGLRTAAAGELDHAERCATSWGIAFRRTKLALEGGGNLQERARSARYEALRAHLGSGEFLATAHHAEDRAETVLLRLLRGTTLEGLGVLPPREGYLLRPMIRAPRAAVLAHVRRHRLAVCCDPSNGDDRFLRVRVRRELLPLMESLSPGVVSHLCELADEVNEGALPVFCADGPSGALQREQRRAVRRALRLGTKCTIPLSGGQILRVDGRRQELSWARPVQPEEHSAPLGGSQGREDD